VSSLIQRIHKGHNVWRETPIWWAVIVDNLGELLREGVFRQTRRGTDQYMQGGSLSIHRGSQ